MLIRVGQIDLPLVFKSEMQIPFTRTRLRNRSMRCTYHSFIHISKTITLVMINFHSFNEGASGQRIFQNLMTSPPISHKPHEQMVNLTTLTYTKISFILYVTVVD